MQVNRKAYHNLLWNKTIYGSIVATFIQEKRKKRVHSSEKEEEEEEEVLT